MDYVPLGRSSMKVSRSILDGGPPNAARQDRATIRADQARSRPGISPYCGAAPQLTVTAEPPSRWLRFRIRTNGTITMCARNNPVFVGRDLDSFEEFFFYMERVAPTLHIHAVHLTGSTHRDDWVQAWRELHRTNPLLRARVEKALGKRPHFVETDRDSPLYITDWNVIVTLEMLAKSALARPFADAGVDMVRLEILHRPNECLLVLSAHHSLYDGMGTLLLLQELLAIVGGEPSRNKEQRWTSLRELVGAPPHGAYTSTLTEGAGAGSSDPVSTARSVGTADVRHLVLDRALTIRLEEGARANGTTPHGALMAAFQISGARSVPDWADKGLNCNTAHNVRPALEEGGDMTGMLTMPIVTHLNPISDRPFWEIARTAQKGIAPGRSPAGRLAFIEAMDALTSEEVTAAAFLQKVLASPIQYQLMITNYASYRPRSDFGHLRIASIITGVDGGGPQTQTIGCCTVHGALNISLISKRPLANLLENCRDVLASYV
ncbi:MAG TPA: hypothetical protein PK706_21485 [Xanthobacteraceae bacterium]|nr:hypothetical protein [Xanthobacteraceae bacterium]